MSETNEVQDQMADAIEIDDLDHFIHCLKSWHENAVATVKQIQNVPDGMEVQVDDGEPFKLTGTTLEAFKMGIGLSLNYLGELPFSAEYEDVESVH